ncbi:DNA glycosylase AlkZ-like family protein [Streptomyces sp. CB02115]|uniref:DNA glycosylase AlkZ-like family protein n=1 Tax=Streptomyces sp. CB02115 TaxID=1703939 RepID=UPI000AE971C0|nr:crosslink repair DNA glycosylase YcaQ family protein [Streptomyces sp. CB02115]
MGRPRRHPSCGCSRHLREPQHSASAGRCDACPSAVGPAGGKYRRVRDAQGPYLRDRAGRHRNPQARGPTARPRTLRLFGFTQVFEAYKPAARRRHGYYVCPVLADGRLIGRADLARRGDSLTTERSSLP